MNHLQNQYIITHRICSVACSGRQLILLAMSLAAHSPCFNSEQRMSELTSRFLFTKRVNCANLKETDTMHGLFPLHLCAAPLFMFETYCSSI